MTQTPMSNDERRFSEEFCQVLEWVGTPHRVLAEDWYSGMLTIEEGQRIEEGRQVWQPYTPQEVR